MLPIKCPPYLGTLYWNHVKSFLKSGKLILNFTTSVRVKPYQKLCNIPYKIQNQIQYDAFHQAGSTNVHVFSSLKVCYNDMHFLVIDVNPLRSRFWHATNVCKTGLPKTSLTLKTEKRLLPLLPKFTLKRTSSLKKKKSVKALKERDFSVFFGLSI